MKYRISVLVEDPEPLVGSLLKDLAAYGEVTITAHQPYAAKAQVIKAAADLKSYVRVGSGREIVLEALGLKPQNTAALRALMASSGRSPYSVDSVINNLRKQDIIERAPEGLWKLK